MELEGLEDATTDNSMHNTTLSNAKTTTNTYLTCTQLTSMHKTNELKASPVGIQGLALHVCTTTHYSASTQMENNAKGITMHKHVGVHLQRDQDTCRVINKVINKRGKQMLEQHA